MSRDMADAHATARARDTRAGTTVYEVHICTEGNADFDHVINCPALHTLPDGQPARAFMHPADAGWVNPPRFTVPDDVFTQEHPMTAQTRHDELKALLNKISEESVTASNVLADMLDLLRERLPEREGAKDETARCSSVRPGHADFVCTKPSGHAGKHGYAGVFWSRPAPADDPRPDSCCGKCPPIVGGGYDCTCDGNPRCARADTPEEWHVEPAPADDLPGEPVEPEDLRAGDKVAFTYKGERITCTLAGSPNGLALRSYAPDSDGYRLTVVWSGEWAWGISDVRLIERAPREGEDEALAMDLYHASLKIPPVSEIGPTAWDDATRQKWLDVARAARGHIEVEVLRKVERATDDRYDRALDRAEKAEAKAVDYEERYERSHATNMAAQSALVRAEAERDALRERLDALRADVEGMRERWLHDGVMLTHFNRILTRDGERAKGEQR